MKEVTVTFLLDEDDHPMPEDALKQYVGNIKPGDKAVFVAYTAGYGSTTLQGKMDEKGIGIKEV